LRGPNKFFFSADAWNNITLHGEVSPAPHVPLSLAFGTFLDWPLSARKRCLPRHAAFQCDPKCAHDRVASETANVIFPGAGATIMAVAIMISTFGCNNGLILAGHARITRWRATACSSSGRRAKQVPRSGLGLVIQGIWAGALVLPRTVKTDATGAVTGYGNLYGNLLDTSFRPH